MSLSANNSGSAGSSLGPALKDLRLQRGLSGKHLAELAGMSQSKISRIETGLTMPSDADVARLSGALGADETLTRELLAEARRSREPANEWESGEVDLASRQQETEHIEVTATDIKVFQPTLVVGLLQISPYAEAVLTAMQKLAGPDLSGTPIRAVSARVHRQGILDEETKKFDFVMTEAALSNRYCSAEDMLAQIRRIEQIAQRPNVTISVIPNDLPCWSVPPVHAFSIYDDKYVFVDLFDTGLSKHDESEGGFYGRVFAAMKAQATTDIGPLLNKHRRIYLAELTRDEPGAS
jgi:transcriptional regulator with XRE-family HTH domain